MLNVRLALALARQDDVNPLRNSKTSKERELLALDFQQIERNRGTPCLAILGTDVSFHFSVPSPSHLVN